MTGRIGSIVLDRNPALPEAPEIAKTLFPISGWRENSYSHEIRAMGWFWNCGFDILGSAEELIDLYSRLLGARVRSFEENGDLAWEGYVNDVSLLNAGEENSISLNNLANKVWLRYRLPTATSGAGGMVQRYDPELTAKISANVGADGSVLKSTIYHDLISQARYGIKEEILDGGERTAASANQVAQVYLKTYSNISRPTRRYSTGGAGERAVLKVFCKGFVQTLKWRMYKQTVLNGTDFASVQVQLIVNSMGDFIKATDIELNISPLDKVFDQDRSGMDDIFDAARVGEANYDRFIVGVKEDRVLVYEKASPPDLFNVKYRRGKSDSDGLILEWGQSPVALPLVRPNNWYQSDGVSIYNAQKIDSLHEDEGPQYVEAVIYREPNVIELIGENDQLLDVIMARSARSTVSLL